MKLKSLFLYLSFLSLLFVSCKDEEKEETQDSYKATADKLIICNEGNWQSDNGQLSFYDGETNTLINKWFRQVNGVKLGDTPNDIVQINDTLLAIAVNWSNIIQFIRPDGRECGATENVPNNRCLCTDGKFLYVTSFAHKCEGMTFEKGFVAKIDVATRKVVSACEVGYEPEDLELYNGKLYVANTGGYSFSERDHDYETTIDVIDATTMKHIKTIDTKCINLCGKVSRAGKFLCVGSAGDNYTIAGRTIILNLETEQFSVLDFPSTCSTTDGKLFYTLGSSFSYLTGEYKIEVHTINPETLEVKDEVFCESITKKILELESPYDLYLSPYTDDVYFTDAKSYASAGFLYGYKRNGEKLFEPHKVYINPSHIIALKQ